MQATRQDLLGRKAFSQDGTKIGKVKDVISDAGTSCEYLVIRRFWSCDLVIPIELVERSDGTILVPFSQSFLDLAPALETRGVVSGEDRSRLEHYYRVRTM